MTDTKHISIGDYIEAGQSGTEDYDRGTVIEINGPMALVSWDSGVVTPCPVTDCVVTDRDATS